MDIQSWINSTGQIAGSLTAIVGLLTLIFFKPIKKAWTKRKEEKKKDGEFKQNVLNQLSKIRLELGDVQRDVAELQRNRLIHAHDKYVRRGWCTPEQKREITQWHDAYKSRGHNHLIEHYNEDILDLPDEPPEERMGFDET